MILTRRSFLGLFGATTAAAIVVPELVLEEPRRRFWQVPRNAPVSGSAAALLKRASDEAFARHAEHFDRYLEQMARNIRESMDRRLETAMLRVGSSDLTFDVDERAPAFELANDIAKQKYGDIWLADDQGFTFDPHVAFALTAPMITAIDTERKVITLNSKS